MSAYFSAAQIALIGEGLKSCTFPAAQFHHREHCLATAYFLLSDPDTDWHAALPDIIRRYNIANGGSNTDSSGYHETLTQFYLQAIHRFLNSLPRCSLEEACVALLASPLASKEYPLRFYSAELLASPTARRTYLLPNIPA